MIVLPNHLIKSRITPGTVLKLGVKYPDGDTGTKRVIVVSTNNEVTIVVVSSTSKTAKDPYFYKHGLLLKQGESPIFEKETFIQCHRVLEMNADTACDDLNDPTKNHFQILGQLTPNHLNTINQEIQKAPTVENKYKKRLP